MCYILIVGNRVNSMNYFSKVHLSHLFQKLWAWRNSLTRAIPIISSSFELLFDRYCKIPNLTKSVDVVLIRHNDNAGSSSISTKGGSLLSRSINDESEESLVDTTLSIFKDVTSRFLLLFFFLFVRKG